MQSKDSELKKKCEELIDRLVGDTLTPESMTDWLTSSNTNRKKKAVEEVMELMKELEQKVRTETINKLNSLIAKHQLRNGKGKDGVYWLNDFEITSILEQLSTSQEEKEKNV